MTSVLVSSSSPELITLLQTRGADVTTWPSFAVSEPDDPAPLDNAIEDLFGYDWLLLKNETAARCFLRRFVADHRTDELDDLRILTIGHTAGVVADSQIHVDISVDRFRNGTVFRELEAYAGGSEAVAGLNFLLPSANLKPEAFELALVDAGARVDNVAAYRTCSSSRDLSELRALLLGEAFDWIVFHEPETLEEFAAVCDTDDLARWLTSIKVVCGDQSTAEVARKFGLSNATISPEPTASSLASLMLRLLS
jgi:uroporphyrinogen-III synthase